MLQINRISLLFAILFSAASQAQFTDVINSNRPGESMAAFSVGKTVIQAELGFYAQDQKYDEINTESFGYGSDLMVRYGAFFEQLEDTQPRHRGFEADGL